MAAPRHERMAAPRQLRMAARRQMSASEAARPSVFTAFSAHPVPTSRVVVGPGSSRLPSPPGAGCRTSTVPSPPASTGRELDRPRRRQGRRHGSDRQPPQRGRRGVLTALGGTPRLRSALLVAPTGRTQVRGYSGPSLAAALPHCGARAAAAEDGRGTSDGVLRSRPSGRHKSGCRGCSGCWGLMPGTKYICIWLPVQTGARSPPCSLASPAERPLHPSVQAAWRSPQ
jgi:hypothetical protein